ncbi:hypothetical protein HHL22_13440 [Hymenobacter sp. RP-2-7]|uniref:Uncharacterized protein n=1 Tax=Hymenobacter polaris TaxID=2682546 RepID=A0A7Y0FN52_9BACT|nr:hypothetical protein [Hymenobacter polaris]NML66211.1 hypothetical protein [Hymenobacter polaris]
MPNYTLPPTTNRPERPLHRLGRWLIYLVLVLAGGTGYACGVSCTRAQPEPESPGALVQALPQAMLPALPHA